MGSGRRPRRCWPPPAAARWSPGDVSQAARRQHHRIVDGSKDVSKVTKPFIAMVLIDGDLHAPPRVEFRWGEFVFTAVVEKISQRFTMFRPGLGTPFGHALRHLQAVPEARRPAQQSPAQLGGQDETPRLRGTKQYLN